MIAQNQIKRVLLEPSSIQVVCRLLANKEIPHSSALAALVCQQFGFHDARGQQQRAGCLKALRELEAAGHFSLPAARTSHGRGSPRRLPEPVRSPTEVPDQAGLVRGLELALVNTSELMRIWNELMINEHPQGSGPLVGRQLRYLISSQHGWLGGFGFAAALHLADRDQWIGWDDERRREYLHFVVGMSRFLLRPSVECRNLASKVLSLAITALPDDFERQFGYRPWLVESFVDTSGYSGTCYRAANWTAVGRTKGRGRQDRFNQSALSAKAIYVYPLESDFRKRMGLGPDAGLSALSPADGLEADQWAENEFGGASLGDARLSRRLTGGAPCGG